MEFFKTTPKTVDGVLTAFKTAIADLETVAVQQSDAADVAAEEARLALQRQADAKAEAERATDIATKMKAIFS